MAGLAWSELKFCLMWQPFIVKFRPLSFILWLIVGLSPCLATEVVSKPLRASGKATGSFSKLPLSETGLAFENLLKPEHVKNYLLLGAGVTVGDIDGDGLPDLFLCSQDGPNKLFRQTRPWTFEDITAQAGITHQRGWSSGAAFADVDNDGDLDLFVCNKGNHNELYRNQGDGTFKGGFVQQAQPEHAAPTMAAFSDYDRDGDLDLYLTRTRLLSLQERFGYRIGLVQDDAGQWKPHPQYGDEFEVIDRVPRELGGDDQLFENSGLTDSGIPRFTDVTAKAGMVAAREHGLAAVWWDANQDDWPDLYVSNDFHTPDRLYLNQQDGTFQEASKSALPYTSWSSMGSDFADINNDGLFDYLSTDMSATTHYKQKTMMGSMLDTAWFLDHLEPRQYMRNVMLVNTGTSHFLECAQFAGIDSTDWTWSALFGDLDSDGWEDLFFTNGIERNVNDSDLALRMDALKKKGARFAEIQQAMLDTPRHLESNLAYRNLGNLQFEDVSQAWQLDLESVSHGAVLADMDRDGDLDIIVNNMNDPVALYRNDIVSNPASMLIQLRGTQSNHFGLGARLVAETTTGRHSRLMTSSRGYMSGAEPVIHLAVTDSRSIDRLTIHWPSGIIQQLTNIQTGQFLTITEPDESSEQPEANQEAKSLFREAPSNHGLTFVHREDDFDDFAKQPLLPNRLSRFGPALAAGDVNGDQRDDLFVGGAAGQAGTLFLQSTNGTFTQETTFTTEASHEDTAALFADLDQDGDRDLYIVSGGNSKPAGDPHYHDRILLNNGRGTFTPAPANHWPILGESGSCVAAADVDRDGDVDLFVGSRTIPQRYPHASASTLILNGDSPRSISLELGLVTAATWADVDGDGWVDLLVTREWGTPAVLRNEKGTLSDITSASGLGNDAGWWNGIATGDLDADGDIDFVASNFGLNTKYHASQDKPVHLYAGDFEGDGSLRLIEASHKDSQLLPLRGKSCSTHAMPHLAQRFPTYHDFASATLTEIYTPAKLDAALKLEATTLASMVFLNDGQGHFTATPLPTLAQLAPGFGIALHDMDRDGHLDGFMAQNFYHPQRETGRMNASLNTFLKGTGKGTFEAIWPKASGLQTREDSRGVVLLDSPQSTPQLIIAVNDGPLRVFQFPN